MDVDKLLVMVVAVVVASVVVVAVVVASVVVTVAVTSKGLGGVPQQAYAIRSTCFSGRHES